MAKYVGKRDDEVFVGNVDTKNGIPEYLGGLKTVRLGEQALDVDGNKISPDVCQPMFVGRSEADQYDRIMMARLSSIRRGLS